MDPASSASQAAAERLISQRRFQEAHGTCLAAIRAEPAAAWPYALLGRIAADHGTFDKAADLFQRAWRLEPGAATYGVALARCLSSLNRHGAAMLAARRALALGPEDAAALDTLGVVLSRADRQDLALDCFREASARDPTNASYFLNLGWAEQFVGDFAAAARAWRRAVELEPDNDRAWSALVRMERQTPEANAIFHLQRLFRKFGADGERRLQIGHALAKSFEDLGDHPQALDWLIKAKSGKRARVAGLAEWQDALFTAAATTAAGSGAGGAATAEPLFVFGLPRSGTTLLERILSSHPAVIAAGEPMDFPMICRRLAGAPTRHLIDGPTLAAAGGLDPARLGAEYVAAIRARAPGGDHFIDKTPLNVLYAGLIHQALPNARMICLRRHPMDSCLSIFRQVFAGEFAYYDWVYDLEDVARFYVAFDRLVAHWRQTLPSDRFIEVAYEDVIADQEGVSRRLLAWLGLPWDDAVLAFHENDAPVATASASQVRSPIYGTSVGRWKRYGEGLKPMVEILASAGLMPSADS